MITFKKFIKENVLKEYLTPEQENTALKSGIEMSPKARKNTDHFFGEGNDRKIEEINHYEHDKSEIHRKVERHLGQQISHNEYKSGLVKDKYGRDAKIGKLIKDNSLRNEFASDSTRSGSKNVKRPYMSIVRGIHVMGQTNPEPDAIHPTGHSWKDQSCKNISSGSNRRYLENEVHHGSVVVFGHDHDGKEIYRATLQPHSNDKGHVAYAVDGEYGIKHPSFVAHAHDVARRLSGEHKGGDFLYIKHKDVYNDTGDRDMLHPSTTEEHITKALDGKDSALRVAAIQHPKVTAEHITKALDPQNDLRLRVAAIKHPKATEKHITKALNDEHPNVREAAVSHPNATEKHITKALNEEDEYDEYVRMAAIMHPKATPEHITKALGDEHELVRSAAIMHPKATENHIYEALNDIHHDVRQEAIRNPNATPRHISIALHPYNDRHVREAAIKHPKVTAEHITNALNDVDHYVRHEAIKNPKATEEHITKALNDSNPIVREAAVLHPKATPEHISKALDDRNPDVREAAIRHPKATEEHLKKAMNDQDSSVRNRARKLMDDRILSDRINNSRRSRV